MIPILVLLVVFVLIAVRQVGHVKFKIWPIMLLGALAVLLTGQISFTNALMAVNIDVMLFLFGMFVVGHALEESGYLSHLSYKIFKRAKSADSIILLILFGAGIASAFLMNDTLAVIGTPVMLLLAKKHKFDSKVLLLTLAFAVTIGSVMSPIGNPQNLLVAVGSGISNPFVTFFKFLLLPTLVNLLLAYLLIKLFYREQFSKGFLNHSYEPVKDYKLAILSKVSLILVIVLVFVKILAVFLGIDFRLTYIALISAVPVLLFSPRRLEVVKEIDWGTLVFFAAMFVLMQSVWDSGFFQSVLEKTHADISSVPMIFVVSIVLSQLISNVPLVALYLPMLVHVGASAKGFIALAAGSTIAGNLSVLGAASNVIIIQNAEKKSGKSFTFLDFVKVGVPLTVVNFLVYFVFLSLF
ncbi:MAG: SLC13 family permease [Nanoarchaeota archaeon]|nr:SLC13 family permease [Nanoarchaeota archaeon]